MTDLLFQLRKVVRQPLDQDSTKRPTGEQGVGKCEISEERETSTNRESCLTTRNGKEVTPR